MKITKQQLKRIIKEEMERVQERLTPETAPMYRKVQEIRKILEGGVGSWNVAEVYEQIEEIVTGGTPSDVEDVDDPDWRRPPPGVPDFPPPEREWPSHAGASAEVGGQTVYAKRKPKF